MKIIVSSDWHLKMWNDEIQHKNIPMRLKEIFNTIEQMCQYANQNNIEKIVVAGDINDTKNVVSVPAFVQLKHILRKNKNLEFYLIHGNHDSAERSNEKSAIELLENEDNVRCVVHDEYVLENITLLPYFADIQDRIKKIKTNDILISHFGLNEASLSNGLSKISPINKNNLKNFKLIILGHYHKPQQIDNVWYCGSPIQLKRDEKNEEKRFLVVDTETLEVESVPTEGYRKYYELIVDSEEDIEKTKKEYKKLVEDGNYVCIRKTSKDVELGLDEARIIEDYEEDRKERGIYSTMKLEDQLKKWLEISEIKENKHKRYLDVVINSIQGDAQ